MSSEIVEAGGSGLGSAESADTRTRRTVLNVLRYLVVRVTMLLATVITAVYLIIIIANLGGFVDEIIRSRIDEALMGMVLGGWLSDASEEEKLATIEQTREAMREEAGLNEPFGLRTLRWLVNGLTLDWGNVSRPRIYGSGTTSTSVRDIIVDHLSRTVMVFGAANVLLFTSTVFVALWLTRRQGGWLDGLIMGLSPLASAPAWVYGVILSALLLNAFGFSAGGTFDTWPTEFRWGYVPVMLRHLLLPTLAIFISGLFQGVYAWRSFFLVYSTEDYVDLAYAKGLAPRIVERRYVLRPALPALLTSFALLAMMLWQEVIALEYFFNVAGIGRLFFAALTVIDTPVIVGLTVTFAYLMAVTVLILDIVYLLVDPRIRVGSRNAPAGKPAAARRLRPTDWHLPRLALPPLSDVAAGLSVGWHAVREATVALLRFPSAVIGLVIILALFGVSVYAVTAIPYGEAVALWRGEGDAWARTPRRALPSWVNLFQKDDLPPTMTFDSTTDAVRKETRVVNDGLSETTITMSIPFPYASGPRDMVIDFASSYVEKPPFITIEWIAPDGAARELTSFIPGARRDSYYLSRDDRLKRRVDSELPQEAIFWERDSAEPTVLQGTYTMVLHALLFEPESDVDATLVMYGRVHGLMGTDADGRDMMIALLWGTPIALMFGIVAALAITLGGMLLAATAAWYGGWVDRVIQFLTETNLVIPFFPVSLLIFVLYSKTIWAILGVTVALSIFGNVLKTFRAAFLQVKSSAYVEAAQAYGASDSRIVVRYLIPRIVSVMIPRLIILVPSYVFLEATLAFLGVTDLNLPTWGKLVVASLSGGLYNGADHVVLVPLALLFLTGFAFAMVGLALERALDPRMRKRF